MVLIIGGWFASAFIGKLADQVRSYIGDQYEYQTTKIRDKLEILEGNRSKIQATVHAAEQRGIENPGLKTWLLDLKDACYDAEDVLDMFEYQLVKKKANVGNQMSSISANTKKLFKDARTVAKRLLFGDDNLNEVLKVLDRFDKLVIQMGNFIHLLSLDHGTREKEGESCEIADWRLTDSDFTEPRLFGRQNERTHLINLLLQNGGSESGPSGKIHVLPIVGLGGVGKTTLAQSVYNEEKVKQHFDLTAWVCVSDRFELRRLITEIIESASIEKPHDFYQIKSLDKIRQILKKGLTGKRFLIVLDDVWDEEREKWEKLCSALESGEEGSKVITTTRNYKIAHMMGTKEAITLEGLSYDECWYLFVQCSFGDKKPQNHLYLENIGRQIVKKLGGLPLAAKVVGSLLRSNLKEQHWQEVSESKLWQIDKHKCGIMSVLRLSYEYLPPHLKQCFIYCSLFPKDYCFSKKKLVHLWMAQGFIHPNQENTLEMIGKSYFNELFSRSFFQKAKKKGYVIHDLLHDLAEYLSDGESFRAEEPCSESKPIEIMKKIRHVYVRADNLSVVCNNKYVLRHLRSLVVVGNYELSLDILKELKGLRVLILKKLKQKLTSESFQQMLHLRYLEMEIDDYRYQKHFELPESLCKLYHLQVLSVGDHWYVKRYDHFLCLPKGINRLINLRHLVVCTKKTTGMGTLTSLQELCLHVNQKGRGLEIGQLGGMPQLRKLHIEGLESVESNEQASEAKLRDKGSLEELRLKWDIGSHTNFFFGSHTINNHDGVLEGLEPHQNLKHLDIMGYRGKKCPGWWNGNWVPHLTRIVLWNCSDLEILPPMGQLPFLKKLVLWKMDGVKRIGPEFYGNNTTCSKAFPSLLELRIHGMPELTEWCSRVEGLELFPRLSKLVVSECTNLRGPLCLPSQLRGLNILVTGRLDFYEDDDGTLVIVCPSIPRLKEWVPCENLASVETVLFTDSEMTSFPSEELDEWFQHLTSLRSLEFSFCFKLQSLPSKLINSLPLLQELKLSGCYEIKSLPEEGLSSSLTKLKIDDCSGELAERCEEDGVDWHKISHIPTIEFYAEGKLYFPSHLPPTLPLVLTWQHEIDLGRWGSQPPLFFPCGPHRPEPIPYYHVSARGKWEGELYEV